MELKGFREQCAIVGLTSKVIITLLNNNFLLTIALLKKKNEILMCHIIWTPSPSLFERT